MKAVTADVVEKFSETNVISNSYMQNEKHMIVSDKFQVIQPAAVGNALSERGFKLVSCLTGKSRHDDKIDFQRTISRYRSDTAMEIDGLNLDIIYISKHMGRGCDELRLGFYRGVCANQWAVGTLLEQVRFRHSSNAFEEIQTGIAAVLSQRDKLVETITKMRNRILTKDEVDALAKKYAEIRLAGKDNVINVDFTVLNTLRREDDNKLDLFTVANRLQENVVKHTMAYDMQSVSKKGMPYTRKMNTRVFRESSSQLVDLNGKLFDAALQLVA